MGSDRAGGSRGTAVAALAALTLVPLGAVHVALVIAGALLGAAVVAHSIRTGNGRCLRVALVATLLVPVGAAGLPFGVWWVVAAVWLASFRLPGLAPSSGWLPAGSAGPTAWWLTAGTVVAAGAGLVLWSAWSDSFEQPTVDTVQAVRLLPLPVLIAAVVVFVVANALAEEIAYRGLAFDAAVSGLPNSGAVVSQAVAFGALHIAGFPSGWVGVGLAVGYGLALGMLRNLTGGLRVPIVAHMGADATIAVLALALVPAAGT